ncbi:MAG: hypothetical protein Q7R93_01840 [bacterium]|nr:hypothetical protein [bacterium]
MKEQIDAPHEGGKPSTIERGFKRALLIGTLAAAALTEEGCAPADKNADKTAPNVPEQRQSAVPEKRMSPDEVKQFWASELRVLRGLVESQEYSVPEVRARYLKLHQDILERYGKEVYIQLTINYSPVSRDAIGGSRVLENGPQLGIFTPALKNAREDLKASGDPKWEEAFETLSVSTIIHELDHLASGYVMTPTNTDTSLDARVLREKNAWALTCEHTLEPMVKAGKHLAYSDQIRYDAWVKAGRDVNSPLWEAHVRGVHATLPPSSLK